MNQSNPSPIPKGSFSFCLFIGVAALAVAVWFGVSLHRIRTSCVTVDATVTQTGEDVLLTYEYNGKTFSDIAFDTSKTLSVGDVLTVYIDPDTPITVIGTDSGNSTFAAFLILGILFSVSGIGGMLLRKVLMADRDEIIEAGKFIYADLDKVVYETSITDEDGRHPYIIYCHYEDVNGKRLKDYIVPNLYVDPGPYLEAHRNKIKVYVKDGNYRRYRFDLKMFEEE